MNEYPIQSHKIHEETIILVKCSSGSGYRKTRHGIVLFLVEIGASAATDYTDLEFIFAGLHWQKTINRYLSGRALTLEINNFVNDIIKETK